MSDPEYKKLENIPLDAHNKDNLGLSRYVKGALLFGLAGKSDLLALGITVLLHVLLSTLEDGRALLLVDLSVVDVSKNWTAIEEKRRESIETLSDPKDG